MPLALGRIGRPGLRQRGARRGVPADDDDDAPRAVRRARTRADRHARRRLRHDFAARDLPGHGLKAVARHFGIAGPDRELIPGAEIYAIYHDRSRSACAATRAPTWRRSPALARPARRRSVRARAHGAAPLRAARRRRRRDRHDRSAARARLPARGHALPAHEPGDGTPHSGAALHLFATGVAHRVVKADVASLYPSLMRAFRIGPARDRLGALLALVDRLVEQRLAAKAAARAAPPGSAERTRTRRCRRR